MKTIIAGSRTITNPIVLLLALDEAAKVEIIPTEILTGDADGVDYEARQYAIANHIPVRVFPARWGAHGKAAGPIRNREMAGAGEALIAVWDGASPGTANMIKEAKARGLRVFVLTHNS